MDDAAIKALADELDVRKKAARADLFKRARAFVIHNALGLAVGGGAVFVLLKVL